MLRCDIKNKNRFPKDSTPAIVETGINNHIKKNKTQNYIKDENFKKNEIVKRFQKLYSELTDKQLIRITIAECMEQQQYYNKLYINEFLGCFYALVTIIMSIMNEEYRNKMGDNLICTILLVFISIFSIFLWINIVIGELISLEYDKIRGLNSAEETIFSSGRHWSIVINLFIFFLHPNILSRDYYHSEYYVQINQTLTRNFNSIFTIIVILRFFFVLRFLLYSSKFMQPSSDQLYKSYYFNTNFSFCLKALFKKISFITFTICFLIFGCSSAYMVMILEKDCQPSFANYFNCLYYMCITMVTIGYGDYVAKTDEGRFISMIIFRYFYIL